MPQNKSHKMVGLFVLIGLLCLGGIILHYVSRKFVQDDSKYVVMYFDESIKGLNVGSPVVFKGVEVGKVVKINLLADIEDGTFKMPVFVAFKENKSLMFGNKEHYSFATVLNNLIDKGLRAKLTSANYLTGQLMIELDMDMTAPKIMQGNGEHIEIPTEMSSIGAISKDLQEIPFKENMMQIGSLLKELDDKLPQILNNLNSATAKMDNILEKKSKETTKIMNNFNDTLDDMSKASKSVKNLTDYLERHPEALLKGKGR